MTAVLVGQNLEQRGKRHPSWALLALLCLFTPACSSIQGARGEYVDFIRPDLRPPLVEARRGADSLWGPASESTRGDGIAESRREDLGELVRRFTPTLVLPRGDYTKVNDEKIRLLPTNVELFTDTMLIDSESRTKRLRPVTILNAMAPRE